MYTLLGLVALYAIGHFIGVSFPKNWSERNAYEKTVSVAGVAFIVLMIIAATQ